MTKELRTTEEEIEGPTLRIKEQETRPTLHEHDDDDDDDDISDSKKNSARYCPKSTG